LGHRTKVCREVGPFDTDSKEDSIWVATRVEFRDAGGVHTGVICAAVNQACWSLAGAQR
jgi:hypothetical protein